MNIRRIAKTTLLAFSCAAILAACKASDSAGTATSSVTADAAPTVDPNAINQPIPSDAYKVVLSLAGKPMLSADGKLMVYQVRVKNEGSAPLYGVGKPDGSLAVNLGGMVLGADDRVDGDGGVRDFFRTPLPLLASGQDAVIAVSVPADARLDGRKLRLATVQEGVAWHDDFDTIDVGPFKLDGGVFARSADKK